MYPAWKWAGAGVHGTFSYARLQFHLLAKKLPWEGALDEGSHGEKTHGTYRRR
jgi:hypothetical protein